MVKRCLVALFSLGLSSVSFAQSSVDFANMREDVQGLIQKVNDMSLRIEELEHQNSELRAHAQATPAGVVTPAQLNAAIAQINAAIESSNATNRKEILEIVAKQMQKLATQTNAALDTITSAKIAQMSAPAPHAAIDTAPAAGEAATPLASEKHAGTSYTVQKGDTLALIAKKTGTKFQDLIAENKIADPSKIFVGQVLVIPSK